MGVGGSVYMVVCPMPLSNQMAISKENIELKITKYYIREMSGGQNTCLFLPLKFGNKLRKRER